MISALCKVSVKRDKDSCLTFVFGTDFISGIYRNGVFNTCGTLENICVNIALSAFFDSSVKAPCGLVIIRLIFHSGNEFFVIIAGNLYIFSVNFKRNIRADTSYGNVVILRYHYGSYIINACYFFGKRKRDRYGISNLCTCGNRCDLRSGFFAGTRIYKSSVSRFRTGSGKRNKDG